MKKLFALFFVGIFYINAFSQSSEILPNQGITIKTNNLTTGLFGSSGHGISLQQNWPTIGFNQYRDESNVQRYIGTGYASGNTIDPATGNMYWSTITTGTAGNATPSETNIMTLFPNGRLGLEGINSPVNGLIINGASNISPIISNSASDGALRIYSPMTGQIFTGSQFIDIDKDAIQARKVGTFPNFIKSEQSLRLNPYGGNVGIGTADNSVASTLLVHKSSNSSFGTAVFKGTTHYSHFHFSSNEDTYIRGGKDGSNIILSDVEAGGKVGIGVYPSFYKLEVNGTVRAKEIIVETGWADYVFEENYQLPKLSKVEDFIKTNKHLPDVPSALEIQKNGAKLAQLTTIMMQKIEELTLYSIEQDKKIEKLQNDLVKLQNQK